ncbi:helix-turn-helix transcriptional regulator [Hymenobacter sp. ASUV-10]|uniref:Helix-turn-helix transcriptional regulator n=1 Tax=Hymenobacter aranciens TaxID=3063996 RepID=A0ABT9B5X1_9BACT|nr:helix-turn-helix transcriptional regulator [Hymenobacter sp. ASUV-10]MDO7873664.1 helix-turn-helix transcriptional regulator [Hymenobacter sp. ASUV-10]
MFFQCNGKCIANVLALQGNKPSLLIMAHQGKILKKAVERSGMTQEEAASKMGYATRQAFTALYQKEEFKETQLQKLIQVFGLSREIFFPKSSAAEPIADASCWQQLVEAQRTIIALQQQIIQMSTPNINAPKVQETV